MTCCGHPHILFKKKLHTPPQMACCLFVKITIINVFPNFFGSLQGTLFMAWCPPCHSHSSGYFYAWFIPPVWRFCGCFLWKGPLSILSTKCDVLDICHYHPFYTSLYTLWLKNVIGFCLARVQCAHQKSLPSNHFNYAVWSSCIIDLL